MTLEEVPIGGFFQYEPRFYTWRKVRLDQYGKARGYPVGEDTPKDREEYLLGSLSLKVKYLGQCPKKALKLARERGFVV